MWAVAKMVAFLFGLMSNGRKRRREKFSEVWGTHSTVWTLDDGGRDETAALYQTISPGATADETLREWCQEWL